MRMFSPVTCYLIIHVLVYPVSLKKKIGFRLPTSLFSVNTHFTLIVIRAEKEKVRYKPIRLLLVSWFDVGEV